MKHLTRFFRLPALAVPCLLLLAMACLLPMQTARAEAADRDQPMNIEADALRYDSQQQQSVFTGRVVVTKGSILMRGERLEVTEDAKGNQSAIMTAAPGQRAFFRQKRDGPGDEYIEGEAHVISFDGSSDIVRLDGDALARRLVGAREQDRLTGQNIVYNNRTEVYTVASQGERANGKSGSRVRATLAPRQSAPAASNARPALKSSPTLQP